MSAKGSELKRVRQSQKANTYNNHYKSMMKTSIKKVLGSTKKEDAESLKNQAFKINIQKNIPHGSGLGGGSSNAADLLKYFNLKMRLKLKKNKLGELANQIGFSLSSVGKSDTEWSYEEVIKSRTMARILLKHRFDTEEFGRKKELLQMSFW